MTGTELAANCEPLMDRLIAQVETVMSGRHIHVCYACGVTEYICACALPDEPMICASCDGEVF